MTTFLLSDVHYGKKTSTFNTEVCRQRLQTFLSKLKDGDRVLMLGDMVDGTGIYPSQTSKQDVLSVEKQCVELAEYIASLILPKFVEVYGVPGNHGRTSSHHELDNWDVVFYRYLSQFLEFEDLVPETLLRILPDGTLITHSAESYSIAGIIPWTSIVNRASKWIAAEHVKLIAIGHFHSCGIIRLGNIPIIVNGTFISDDDWAFRKFGFYSVPEQVIIHEEGCSIRFDFAKL